jgi:hypothetical protein
LRYSRERRRRAVAGCSLEKAACGVHSSGGIERRAEGVKGREREREEEKILVE